MSKISTVLLAMGGAFALTLTSASAAVVCNDEGDCWHVKSRYEYRPEFRLHVHPDDWSWTDHSKYRWREHEGRGYWRRGVWVEF